MGNMETDMLLLNSACFVVAVSAAGDVKDLIVLSLASLGFAEL